MHSIDGTELAVLLHELTSFASSAGSNVEQRAAVMRAVAEADDALQWEYQRRYVRSYNPDPGLDAYWNVQEVLMQVRYPERIPDFVENEDRGKYDAEVKHLIKIVESVLSKRSRARAPQWPVDEVHHARRNASSDPPVRPRAKKFL